MTTIKDHIKLFLFKLKLYKLNSLQNRFYILGYHMVSDRPNGFYPEISTYCFEKQIAHVVDNYRVKSLDEIVQRVKNKKSVRNCLAITFDDGFKSCYDNAYPILKNYNIPATIFLTTKYIENGSTPWFIKERFLFLKTKKKELKFSAGTEKIALSMKTEKERFIASEEVMTYLKKCSVKERQKMLMRLCILLEVNNFQELDGLMLSWNQIMEMTQNKISLGAHTVNHPALSKIKQYSAKRELLDSKKIIEMKTGKPVVSFAYPFGKKSDYNPEVFALLEELEFSCALTTEKYPNRSSINLFELNRQPPWELSLV